MKTLWEIFRAQKERRQQLETTHSFEDKLRKYLRMDLELVINDNRSTILSILERRRRYLKVSVHRMFLEAPDSIVEGLAHYLRRRRAALPPEVKAYIQQNSDSIQKPRVPTKLVTAGTIYDLEQIFGRVNDTYFEGSLTGISITWFGNPQGRRRRRVSLGLYHEPLKLIKVHRLLDDEAFPDFFVEFVVFHEMLHHVVPAYIDEKGWQRSHGPEFKRRERQYQHYRQAKEWERTNKKLFFQH